MENNRKIEMSLWRFGIISPLLHRTANDVSLCDMLEIQSGNCFVRPDGVKVKLSPETIRKWLYRYNYGGLQALADKTRSDKGRHAVPESIRDAMAALRGEHPRWTLALLLETLVEKGLWDGKTPSRSVLYRYARAHNLMRDPHLASPKNRRTFQFEYFGQLWTADFMHGPKLKVGRKKRKCYLHVIIDDSTRYVVSGRFYLAENVESLILELMTATRRFGLGQRLYTDNGAAYASRHLKIVCARLGMHLSHTPPYKPEGRSKVERFFRSVRERFLAKQRFTTLDEMNRAFALYLEDYHNRIHSTLKCTPMQKRLSGRSVCRHLPEVVDIEALFRYERRCRVYKDGTIQLKKRIFEVPGCLPGSRVNVYFMPWDLSRVYYGDEMQLAAEVDRVANAHRHDHPNFARTKEDYDERF
ncbi:MAG: DDE-type integrase/transposase/recombinase [Desulfuromonadales bacterium]|nr:DDE-type integrase/transposase/recombinase [Desulfuromonadales bacterium]